ncbi:hypothetical protein HJC23_003994 [Cyclotella cryptica]|uniref:Uncharacterized protein n=1 Tax=Cyclotella cryptica TaxID=29204 RepID=A0ABD3QTK0_9STRA|eukprot:CCRYP_001978-RA/>CCRYP_001978-RA protein AED:0.39 eAED:0.39 QI:0/-1/0/1/-1/1/1/0/234
MCLAALSALLAALAPANAFTYVNSGRATCSHQHRTHRVANSQQLSMTKTTLTDETTWRLRLLLNDLTTAQGQKLNGQLFVIEGSFIEEEGYEPPQGIFQPSKDVSRTEDDIISLEISKSRWTLSEDPNDKKDGLWIWGLFKEPLYPFMLLQLETKEFKLSSSQNSERNDANNSTDSIPPLKLYAQISHIRNENVGVELKTANLNVRVLERVQLPGASVDLYEEEKVGQVSFQPL